jgi:Ser/Thr protein kinase RdoA (MazF antagonist)
MKPFTDLTSLGQTRRLRVLAKKGLRAYGLQAADFHLLQHGENTTFRVDASGLSSTQPPHNTLYHDNRYLLRIHRPGYQNQASIASELTWLAALRKAGLPVPEPVPTHNGDLYTIANASGVPEPRVCSLLRWMNGRFYGDNPQSQHIATVGRLMARLHAHSAVWQPPAKFIRRSWDSEGLFGDNGGFNLPKEQLWALIPPQYKEQFNAVAQQANAAMTKLDAVPGSRGLLHADLHLGNVLFAREKGTGQLEARPIDFDDCGYAHWVYDFAVVLGDYITEDVYPQFHDALLSGYRQVRPLPVKQLQYLNIFIAARLVSLMLWVTDIAQINKGFSPELDGWYAWASAGIQKCMEY